MIKDPNFLFDTVNVPLLYMFFSFTCALFGNSIFMVPLLVYVLLIFSFSTLKNGFIVGCMSIAAMLIQFTGYGLGFLNSYIQIGILKKEERDAFPNLFFK